MREIDFRRTVLPEGAAHFISTFMRFEFALKEQGCIPASGDAKVQWGDVAKELQKAGFFERMQKSGRASTILKEPPKKQVSRHGNLKFEPVDPPRNCDELLAAVRRVRNNLLHGGKSGDAESDERNRTLIAEAQLVVEEVLRTLPRVREDFEGWY